MADFIRTSTDRVRGAATGEQNVPVKPEQFDDWLARHDAEIQAQALREAADETERYAKDTYWRDDSPFHLQSRISAEMHAERLRARAARLTETTEGPTDA